MRDFSRLILDVSGCVLRVIRCNAFVCILSMFSCLLLSFPLQSACGRSHASESVNITKEVDQFNSGIIRGSQSVLVVCLELQP